MAAYVTREELEARFGVQEIADLLDENADGSESASETATLDAAIADASNLIDGYLASRYTLPLSSVPEIVKAWAADIARYKLWEQRAPEEVRQRYEDVVGQLKDVARGHLALPPGSDGNKPSGSLADAIDGFSADRLFTMDTLRDY